LRGDVTLNVFDAMILKREMQTNCSVDVKILDTSKNGLILRIMENTVDGISLELIRDFVNQHKLNILLDNGVYFISKESLSPYEPVYLSE
jgi:hypothetical protein